MKERNALLSVHNDDKPGLTRHAVILHKMGFKIWASGGTAKLLKEYDIPVNDVAEKIGKAVMGHKLVTLSRPVHGALLADWGDADIQDLEELGMPRIDLVCVTFYPFMRQIMKPDNTLGAAVANIDIGGPTMVTSGGKGGRVVITDLGQFAEVFKAMEEHGFMNGNELPQVKTLHWAATGYKKVGMYYTTVGSYLDEAVRQITAAA